MAPLISLVLTINVPVLADTQESSTKRIPHRIASMDWGLTETLLALGVVPVGVADVAGYRRWFSQPALPSGVVDVGFGDQPNLELLTDLRPDLILITQQFAGAEPFLKRVTKTLTIEINTAQGRPFERACQATLQLSSLLRRGSAGAALVAAATAFMEAARAKLRSYDQRPLYLFEFEDARHVTVFGAKGLFQEVLDRLGLRNAWSGPTNDWGFVITDLEHLAGNPEARFVCVGGRSRPGGSIAIKGGLWRSLVPVQSGRVVDLPPILFYGAVPTATRFATLLTDALLKDSAG